MKEGSETAIFDGIFTRKVEGEVHDFLEKSNEKEIKELDVLTPLRIRWDYLIFHIFNHIACVYALYLIFTETKWQTIVFVAVLDILAMLGVTAGAHRLWAHRTYKATLPLRIFLAFIFTISVQRTITRWVRDHRVHHKYSETNADPHNAKRGFLYSHIFWMFTYETEDCLKKYTTIDMSDIEADPVARFHWKYYYFLAAVITVILPTVIPIWMWEETFHSAYFVSVCLRIELTNHQTFLVNSVAHMYGSKPYNANIYPTENKKVSLITLGEGFHNYHHTFPWDYAVSEFGIKYNLTTVFIDLMAWLGLASDRKIAPKSLIEAMKRRTAEGDLKKLKNIKTDSSERFFKKD